MKTPSTYAETLKLIGTGFYTELTTPMRFDKRTRQMFPKIRQMVIDSESFDRYIKDYETVISLIIALNKVASDPQMGRKSELRFQMKHISDESRNWNCEMKAKLYRDRFGVIFLTAYTKPEEG